MKHRRTDKVLNKNDKDLHDKDLRPQAWSVGMCVGCVTETLIAFQVELLKDNKVYDSKQSSWWSNVRQVTGHEGANHVNDHVKKSDRDMEIKNQVVAVLMRECRLVRLLYFVESVSSKLSRETSRRCQWSRLMWTWWWRLQVDQGQNGQLHHVQTFVQIQFNKQDECCKWLYALYWVHYK